MYDIGYFAHNSPVYGHFTNISWELFNVIISGETIARGHQTPQAVVDAWMGSAAHRDILLSPNFVDIGIGFFNNYWAIKLSLLPTAQ